MSPQAKQIIKDIENRYGKNIRDTHGPVAIRDIISSRVFSQIIGLSDEGEWSAIKAVARNIRDEVCDHYEV